MGAAVRGLVDRRYRHPAGTKPFHAQLPLHKYTGAQRTCNSEMGRCCSYQNGLPSEGVAAACRLVNRRYRSPAGTNPPTHSCHCTSEIRRCCAWIRTGYQARPLNWQRRSEASPGSIRSNDKGVAVYVQAAGVGNIPACGASSVAAAVTAGAHVRSPQGFEVAHTQQPSSIANPTYA